jgi:hypothetical protein
MKNIEYGIICYFDAVAVYYIKVLYTESKQEVSAAKAENIGGNLSRSVWGIPTREIPCYK